MAAAGVTRSSTTRQWCSASATCSGTCRPQPALSPARGDMRLFVCEQRQGGGGEAAGGGAEEHGLVRATQDDGRRPCGQPLALPLRGDVRSAGGRLFCFIKLGSCVEGDWGLCMGHFRGLHTHLFLLTDKRLLRTESVLPELGHGNAGCPAGHVDSLRPHVPHEQLHLARRRHAAQLHGQARKRGV